MTAEYYNPEPLDSCQEFTTKTVYGFKQAFGENNVTTTANSTAGRIIGPVNITVLVSDASDNRLGARGHTVGQGCLLVLHVDMTSALAGSHRHRCMRRVAAKLRALAFGQVQQLMHAHAA